MARRKTSKLSNRHTLSINKRFFYVCAFLGIPLGFTLNSILHSTLNSSEVL